jgi:hypothetical protein
MLEAAMNQSSIQKTDIPVVPEIPEVVITPMLKAGSVPVGFGQPVQSVFNDFNSLDDDEGFPIPKK